MRDLVALLLIAGALLFVALFFMREGGAPAPRNPDTPVCPGPNCPVPAPKPNPPFPFPPRDSEKLWIPGNHLRSELPIGGIGKLLLREIRGDAKPARIADPLLIRAQVGKRHAPDGTEIQLDLPEGQHLRNKGGSDGAGLCVFTSCEHSANWQSVRALYGFRDWMTRYPGGGYPAKLDAMIKRKCSQEGKPVPEYVQMEGYDPEVLRKICGAGLMPAITYYRSPTGRYGGSKIYHMVTLVHADERWFGVLDNNYPKSVEYMSEAEFKRCHTDNGIGWTVFFLRQGPPPIPGGPRTPSPRVESQGKPKEEVKK